MASAWAWVGEPHVALITLLSGEMNDNGSGKCILVFKHIISVECTTTTYAPSTLPSPLPWPTLFDLFGIRPELTPNCLHTYIVVCLVLAKGGR